MNYRLGLVIIAFVTVISGCSNKPSDANQPVATELARAVTVGRVELRPMASSLVVSGVLVAREEATVGSELSGYSVEKLFFDAGETVPAGAVLATLNPELLMAKIAQAQASVEQANAQANQSLSEATRVAGLDGRGVLSDENIQIRRSQAHSAAANTKVAIAQLNQLLTQEKRLTIRAPVAGLILERHVRQGDIANNGDLLFLLARDSLIEVNAEVPEQSLALISVGQSVTVTLSSGIELEGVTRLISPQIDPLTKLGRVRISLPNSDSLRVGAYARVTFNRSVLPIPAVLEKAIQFEANGPSLIVIDSDNRAQRVAIKTTTRSQGYVAIEQGPPVGTRIALGGGAFLLEGDLVDPIELANSVDDTSKAKNP